MKVHEYQAKELFRKYGIPVPEGAVAASPKEAADHVRAMGGRAVIKAQVHAGGRGKAGGVKVVSSPEEGEKYAAGLIGSRLVTHQTGPEGVPVDRVLVEELIDIARELYVSVIVEPSLRMPVMIASAAGGMDIEEVAATTPEKIVQIAIDPVIGFQPYMGRKAARGLGLPQELVRPAGTLFANPFRLFEGLDCTLAEVNPLAITADNRLLAADAKLAFDDDALRRHPELAELRDDRQEDPLDVEANRADVNYIRLDGEVGCMVNGAGLAMATLDIIGQMGSQPANFLDVGGGASEEQISRAFTIMLSDPKVKKVLINIFGGILRCDVAARGIVAGAREKGVDLPLVVRMRGTNAEEGRRILAESGLRVVIADNLQEAAQNVVQAV